MDLNPAHVRRALAGLLAVVWLLGAAWAGYRWLVEEGRLPAPALVPIPARPPGAVLDLASVLTTTGALEQALKGSQVAAVTVAGVKTYGDPSIEQLARRWHRAWGLGEDGSLLLLSPVDRQARIELSLTRARQAKPHTDAIMNEVILPLCKQGDYGKALLAGAEKLIAPLPAPEPWWQRALALDNLPLLGTAALLALIALALREADPAFRVLLGGYAALVAAMVWPEQVTALRAVILLWSAVLALAVTPAQTPSGRGLGVVFSLGLLAVLGQPDPALVTCSWWLLKGTLYFVAGVAVLLVLARSERNKSSSSWESSSYSSSDSYSSDSSYGASSYSAGDYSSASGGGDSGGGSSSDSGSTGSW